MSLLSIANQDEYSDPAITYIVIRKRPEKHQASNLIKEQESFEEAKQESKTNRNHSDESLMWDVKTHCAKRGILEIKEEVVIAMLGSDKDEIQIADVEKLLERFDIWDEGIELH